MKPHLTWSYAPYKKLCYDHGDIYICRVVPDAKAIHFEWLPLEDGAEYTVYCRKRGTESFWEAGSTQECSYDITGLETGVDYEFYLACGEKKSLVRLARAGECVLGTVINYLHPDDKAYIFSGHSINSPSMVKLPDGTLVASMDTYHARGSGRVTWPSNLTLVYRSEDGGKTWKYACELFPCFLGKLFVYQGELYMLALATGYGDLLIGKSTDGGRSFCEPTVLLRSSTWQNQETGVHKNPQPVVEYGGRIWNTMEWGNWGKGFFAAMVMSAEVGSDLLKKESWLFSEPVMYDNSWEGAPKGTAVGPIEGCLTVAPDGKLYNIMRFDMDHMTPNYGLAIVYEVNTEDPEAPLKFSRAMEFPANHAKFEVKYDEKSGRYYSIACRILDASCYRNRTLLSLMSSKDLYRWEVVTDLVDRRDRDPLQEGYQYCDFEFDGDDIIYMCRAAFNGAYNFHDVNYEVFARIENFRTIGDK